MLKHSARSRIESRTLSFPASLTLCPRSYFSKIIIILLSIRVAFAAQKRFPSVPSVNPDLLGGCDFKSPLHRCGSGGQGSQRGQSGQCLGGLGSNLTSAFLTCEVEIPAPAAENVNVN